MYVGCRHSNTLYVHMFAWSSKVMKYILKLMNSGIIQCFAF